MQIGVHYLDFTMPGEPASTARLLAETARAAEDGGCAWFTVMDHWFQMEQFAHRPRPDARGLHDLGFVAGVTSTMHARRCS